MPGRRAAPRGAAPAHAGRHLWPGAAGGGAADGVVKLEQVKQTGDFLSSLFPLLFIPTAVGVMEVWDLIAGNLIPIFIALLPVTWAVMAVAGKVTQKIMDKGEKNG